MILLRFIFPLFLLLSYYGSYCQIDPHKVDSLSKEINLSAKNHKKWQDSFTKIQDSIYQTTVVNKNSNQLQENKKVEDKKRQNSIVRLIIGVLFCVGLITGFVIRKKPKS